MTQPAKRKTKPTTPRKPTQPVRRDAGRPRGEPIAEVVLERTLEELASVGMAELNIDRIAQAAEVNKTTVYRRWPTREALIAAALERVLGDLTLQQKDTGSLRGDLLFLGESVVAFLTQPVGRALAHAVFAESTAPSIAALARRQLETSAGGPAASMVQRAMARGEWRADVAPVAPLSMLVGAVLHRTALEHQEPSRTWLIGIIDILLRGVCA